MSRGNFGEEGSEAANGPGAPHPNKPIGQKSDRQPLSLSAIENRPAFNPKRSARGRARPLNIGQNRSEQSSFTKPQVGNDGNANGYQQVKGLQSSKIVKRLDRGRAMGKPIPKKVRNIYETINPKNLETHSQISCILFIKQTKKLPTVEWITQLLQTYEVYPTLVEIFRHQNNETLAKIRVKHPTLLSLSLLHGPEMGLSYVSKTDGSIRFRIEVAKSGH